MNLVWKLLRQHLSIGQFVGFFLANLVGMVIILLGVQFYIDMQAIYNGEDTLMKDDYIIVNKQISTVASLTGKSGGFSDAELADIAAQPFVEQVGVFTSSAFDVSASFDLEQFARFSTDMFFESVPDAFVDVKSDDWHYVAGAREIPIVLPRNYLDLYNFGYAQSRNMPKLSEGILGAMKLVIRIKGDGMSDSYEGRIVGFSSRLNTILVPQTFMEWANSHYAKQPAKAPTRVIMQVNNPTDDKLTRYLQDNSYVTDQAKLDASKTTFVLRVVVAIVMAIGLVISALAFYILMLSIYLLVQKNSSKLENLLLIGYSPARVSRPYQSLAIALSFLCALLAIGVLMLVRSAYLGMFEDFFPSMQTPSLWAAMFVAAVLLLIVSVINVIAVKRKVLSIWNRKD